MQQAHLTRWLVGGLVAVGALAFLGPLLLGAAGGPMGMAGGTWGPMHGSGMGPGAIGTQSGWWLFLAAAWRVLLLVALVGGGYLLYRAVAADRADPAITELRRAYARGDLSEEEYERRRNRLQQEQ
ncbi:SHOCT domain-containing protein [Halobellus sp. Atlit-31R]|nr:SHOCT domain-containing protein [Halobellus sp. Atlit-31R]